MNITYSHQLSQSEAVTRIKKLFDLLQENNQVVTDLKTEWNSDKTKVDYAFQINGQLISGQIVCENNTLIFRARLPFAARLFQNKIKNLIRERLDDVFTAR
jgi:hypothetical protein